MLTDYHLLYALSLQRLDVVAGTLSFAPLFACPFALPFVAMGREGTVACSAAGQYSLGLAFGSLNLPAGGLSVNGKVYTAPLALTAGESVTW